MLKDLFLFYKLWSSAKGDKCLFKGDNAEVPTASTGDNSLLDWGSTWKAKGLMRLLCVLDLHDPALIG